MLLLALLVSVGARTPSVRVVLDVEGHAIASHDLSYYVSLLSCKSLFRTCGNAVEDILGLMRHHEHECVNR